MYESILIIYDLQITGLHSSMSSKFLLHAFTVYFLCMMCIVNFGSSTNCTFTYYLTTVSKFMTFQNGITPASLDIIVSALRFYEPEMLLDLIDFKPSVSSTIEVLDIGLLQSQH